MKNLFAAILAILLAGCGVAFDDKAWVDSRASAYYSERGFQMVGYQGYNIWTTGRCYWYTLRRDGTTYESCLLKWGTEVHEYGLKAIDAFSPKGQ